jgi:hypothetical protein
MAAETTESFTHAGGDGIRDATEAAGAGLEEMESQARSFIREYPLASLAAAVLAGYIAARLLPRI